MLSPETWYVLWILAFVALIAGLAAIRAQVGRWWRSECGDEPEPESRDMARAKAEAVKTVSDAFEAQDRERSPNQSDRQSP